MNIANEILFAIDNIYQEQYRANSSVAESLLSVYDKQQMILESCEDVMNLPDAPIMEADYTFMAADLGQKEKNNNIFQKIWNAIKNFFKMIADKVKSLIDRITSKGETPGGYQSCNSVLLKILSKSKSNIPDNIDSYKIPAINPKYLHKDVVTESYEDSYDVMTEDDFVMEAADSTKYITVNIPVGMGSTVYPKTIRVPNNDILAVFDNDDKNITFHVSGFGKWTDVDLDRSGDDAPEGISEVTGTKKPWIADAKIPLYLITNREALDKLIELSNLATAILMEKKEKHIKLFDHKMKSIIDDIEKHAKKVKFNKYAISLKDLTYFQKALNKINYKMDQFANVGTDVSDLGKDTINNLTFMTRRMIKYQTAFNLLTSALNDNYIVDARFIGCIRSVALLDQFVATCIKQGLPPKYIAYNTWLVADPCIKGTKEDYKPVWGQTRFVFFPPGKRVVYKIAMTGAGITSNKAEVRTSDLFVKMDRVDLIAPICKVWPANAIIAMECVDNPEKPSYPAVLSYTTRVNDAIAEYEKAHNLHLNIDISDQHKDNVKYDKKYGCYRSIDYGIANRVYRKPDKKEKKEKKSK